MPRTTARVARVYGCATILSTVVVMCVLLVANSLATAAVVKLLGEVGWAPIQQHQRAQAFLLFTPLFLMIAEWWLIDLIVDVLVTRRERKARRKADQSKAGRTSEFQSS